MIQVDHMATVVYKACQETGDDQVVVKLAKGLLRVERERREWGNISGRRVKPFRRGRASKLVAGYANEFGFWMVDWNRLANCMLAKLDEDGRIKMREKVMRYREKKLKDEGSFENRHFRDTYKDGKFYRPAKIHCVICGGNGHRPRECKYTFDRVKEMMLEEEKVKETKRELSLKGGATCVKNDDSFKRSKIIVKGLEELLIEYKEAFYTEGQEVEFCGIEKCKIMTKRGAKVVQKGAMVPQALRRLLDEHLMDLEKRGILRRSESEWRNPIRALQKPDGSIRLVCNLMKLNDLCEKDPYELRNIREVINSTQGSEYLSVLDLKEGFYGIEIEEDDKKKTAFEYDGRVYEWNSMVMGFKNSPQIMQRVLSKILDKWMNRGVNVYMDDIVIYAKTRNEHDKILEDVLKILIVNKLRVNKKKLQFALGEVELLGVRLNGKEQLPNDIKKNEALVYPAPRNLKELRRFLGLAGWFRGFIKDFATVTTKLTDSLRKASNDWKWTDELDKEFRNVKGALSNMSKITLPDYEKEFMLRTDASNVGIGAVLLQERDGKMMPIQWASKKLTPTETRYGISEKEMLAIFWAVKKFEYDLRGRKFTIVTDHKALENIRTKPNFTNNRINRWIEKIQEFDFEVKYEKAENLVVPDALSRLYETNVSYEPTTEKGKRILEGKLNKHVVVENDKSYWISDNGLKREMPEIDKRKELVEETHVKLLHRGIDACYYEMKKTLYWVGMKKTIENVIKNCGVCCRYNRKNSGGSEFIETKRQMEKVGIDLIDLRNEGKYILVGIDYYTRSLQGELIENKAVETVTEVLRKWCEEYTPEEIITDNGKEFVNEYFSAFCRDNNIQHTKVSIESHKSNGRIERAIKTIREGLLKDQDTLTKEKVKKIIKNYNNTYHTAIGKTPVEAMARDDVSLNIANSKYSYYATRFKKGYRETFVKGQKVLIAKNENIQGVTKNVKGRFLDSGVIIEVCVKDSYLVKNSDGRIVKKRHYDLKRDVHVE